MSKKKKEEIKYFLAGLPISLHKQVRDHAHENDISMAEVVRRAVSKFLKIKE